MRVPRFVARAGNELLKPGHIITLDIAESGHLTGVLRRSDGAVVDVVNLETFQHLRCVVVNSAAAGVQCEVTQLLSPPPLPHTHLLLGLPESAVLESVVEKSVEIGAASVSVFGAVRSQNARGRLSNTEKLRARLDRIALTALKQSGAAILPRVLFYADLHEALRPVPQNGSVRKFIADVPIDDRESTAPGISLQQLSKITNFFPPPSENPVSLQSDPQTVDSYVMIGPEGGLTDGEREEAHAAGFLPVSLGPQVLRTETAAIAALAVLRMLGDTAR